MIIDSIELTSYASPVQIEGYTKCGKYFYVKYRYGKLYIKIDNFVCLNHQIEKYTDLTSEYISFDYVESIMKQYRLVLPLGTSLKKLFEN